MTLAYSSRLFYVQVYLFVLSLAFAPALGAQVDRQLISTGGGSENVPGYYVGYSIGEPISGRRNADNASVFQGFEQPDQLEVALPVSWLRFTAEAIGKNNLLSWQVGLTGREASFTIERSSDGLTFLELATLPFLNNNTGQAEYDWTDTDFPPDLLYYRILQTDQNGTETISPLRAIDRRGEAEARLLLYPNPAHGSVTWSLRSGQDEASSELQLFDSAGREVRAFRLRGNSGMLPLGNLPPGAYNYLFIPSRNHSGIPNHTNEPTQTRGRLIVR